MTFLIITTLVIVLVFLTFISQNNKKPESKNNHINLTELIKKQNIDEQQKFISKDFSNALILDKNNNLHFLFIKYKKKTDQSYVYGYSHYSHSQIIQSEIIIDNQSIQTTNRTSQLTGMAIGGLTFGSAGMLIGALTGSKNINEIIKSVELKITVEDLNKPVYKINFLNNKVGYKKDSSEVKAALNNIEKWHGILEVLMKQQNKVTS